jgi:indolepyruvate ferredoxin oxidoreductase, alpha subunit
MHRLLTGGAGESALLLGNEAIARGAVEAGVRVATTYPGTPSSEISAAFYEIAKESDLYFEYSTNEKVALEVAAAAANCGLRSICVMKHVGVNVAADALLTLAYVGVKGGLVIVSADDPYMFSSQNEQDNRYYGKLAGLPVIEPSSVAEGCRMAAGAFALSEALSEPVILRTTTRINHSTAPVVLGAISEVRKTGAFLKDAYRYVTVPAVSRQLHVRLLENLEKARELSEASPYNFTEGEGTWGIICSGVSYGYVSDAVADLRIKEKVRILRIGFSHPLPVEKIKRFLSVCEKVLVVEEGEPYLEESIRAIAQEAGNAIPIRGKGPDLFSRLYEYDPAMVRGVVARFFKVSLSLRRPIDLSDVPALPPRPPNLCAGCSHRATFYAVKKAAEGTEAIFPTDIGCYTLGFLPPLEMGDFVICMGSSVGTAGGFSKATGKKVVAFIGDSTFFHSGIPGLINGVFNNHDFTLVILDNGTTAMTGHQPNPGMMQKEGGMVSIEGLVRGAGVTEIREIRPFNVKKSIATLREAFAVKGVSVVISRELCALYARGLGKMRGRSFYVSDKCRNHRECIASLGCPAFYLEGENVRIDAAHCTGARSARRSVRSTRSCRFAGRGNRWIRCD